MRERRGLKESGRRTPHAVRALRGPHAEAARPPLFKCRRTCLGPPSTRSRFAQNPSRARRHLEPESSVPPPIRRSAAPPRQVHRPGVPRGSKGALGPLFPLPLALLRPRELAGAVCRRSQLRDPLRPPQPCADPSIEFATSRAGSPPQNPSRTVPQSRFRDTPAIRRREARRRRLSAAAAPPDPPRTVRS